MMELDVDEKGSENIFHLLTVVEKIKVSFVLHFIA